jgi:type IV secretion system protein TrbF
MTVSMTQQEKEQHMFADGVWMERYGAYIQQARSWRRIAFCALALAACSTGGVIWLGSQSQLVPYVVKVDKLGTAIAVDRADQAGRPDQAVILAQLARWIAGVRSVYIDASAQKTLITEAYAMINQHGQAYGAINSHMRDHDPFLRAKSETVSVDVQSVLPISGDSWRVEWREETRGRDGKAAQAQQYQATITIGFNPPTDEATIRVNPMGIYINSFSWSKRL